MHTLTNPIWNTLPAIEAYFDSGIPSGPIRLDSVTVVVNVHEFVSGHIATAKAHYGQRLFVPYVERLAKLKEICQR